MSKKSTNFLYLVRHGENTANITKEFSYKLIDYSLTPKGVIQAEQTADYFRTITLDAVYASPLKRAYETGEIIAQHHGLPVTQVEEFREVNIGDLEKLPPSPESWARHNQVFYEWFQGNLEAAFPGGENYFTLVERSRQGLLQAVQGRENQRIVIAGHGGALFALAGSVCELGEEQRTSIMGNCAITEIELTHEGIEFSGNLLSWASTEHLSGEAALLVSPMFETEEA
jgi:broad specificity phosphatase PhoE